MLNLFSRTETIFYTGLNIECSSWPDSPGYSCTEGGHDYEHLDLSFNVYTNEYNKECEYMCRQLEEEGCCYICVVDGILCGCSWKRGANVVSQSSFEDVAVKCSYASGKLNLSELDPARNRPIF